MCCHLHLRVFLIEKKNILSLHVPDTSIVTIVYAVRIEKILEG